MKSRKENFERALAEIKTYLSDAQYGSITLVIQDGVVVQIEKNEKIRLK